MNKVIINWDIIAIKERWHNIMEVYHDKSGYRGKISKIFNR